MPGWLAVTREVSRHEQPRRLAGPGAASRRPYRGAGASGRRVVPVGGLVIS
jgi:hypothetical protein